MKIFFFSDSEHHVKTLLIVSVAQSLFNIPVFESIWWKTFYLKLIVITCFVNFVLYRNST